MKWKVKSSKLTGTIAIPPSKSHTIRALLTATLARGESVIRAPLLKGDGASAIGAARSFGAEITDWGDHLVVKGTGGNYDRGSDFFDMGNSGTSTNLFTSAVALGTRTRRFDGDESLRSRPVKPLLEALAQLGAVYTREDPGRDLPFTIHGPLHGGNVTVNGISSQFVSSLLFTCPLINGDTHITVENLHERPYVELTLWWLDKQGIGLHYDGSLTRFDIQGNQSYRPFDMKVPADFSSATFAAAAGALNVPGIVLKGLDFSDPQGDKGIFDVLRKLGASVDIKANEVAVAGGCLHGGSIDLNAMPDALPALSVIGCTAEGVTKIVNVAQARIKETDRIKVMREELTKMGGSVEELRDGLVIRRSRLKGAFVNGHDDHRVVMALAIAGMIAEGETIIDTAESAEVTYPGFVEDFGKLGAQIEVIN